MENYLIPECHFERELLMMLGFSLKTEINKAVGCSGVLDAMKGNGYRQKVAIGWIDQDPMQRQHRHPDYFNFKEHYLPKYKIRVLQKPHTKHFLIEIEDEFEPWFESIGKNRGIRKEDFGITSNLHGSSKKQIPEKAKKYMEAVFKSNKEPFEYVKSVIQTIKEDKAPNI
jgi:hypothetical protein